jgi:hypothetical protein
MSPELTERRRTATALLYFAAVLIREGSVCRSPLAAREPRRRRARPRGQPGPHRAGIERIVAEREARLETITSRCPQRELLTDRVRVIEA